MTCWSAFANKNQESRQFLTGGVTGAEVITNVLFRGASSLQYLTICKISRTLNICIADGVSIRTLVVWSVAGIEAVMFIAELVLWGIRWGVANQTGGWKQNQERLISCFSIFLFLTRGDPLQEWQEGYFLHLYVCVQYTVSSLAESQLTMTPTSIQFSSSLAPAARSSFDCRAPPAPPSHRPQTTALLPWREQVVVTMFSV